LLGIITFLVLKSFVYVNVLRRKRSVVDEVDSIDFATVFCLTMLEVIVQSIGPNINFNFFSVLVGCEPPTANRRTCLVWPSRESGAQLFAISPTVPVHRSHWCQYSHHTASSQTILRRMRREQTFGKQLWEAACLAPKRKPVKAAVFPP